MAMAVLCSKYGQAEINNEGPAEELAQLGRTNGI